MLVVEELWENSGQWTGKQLSALIGHPKRNLKDSSAETDLEFWNPSGGFGGKC